MDLRNKIWELKEEANVTTNEEHLQEEEEIMPQLEEMAMIPMKMMEDFVPLRKKCASCSSITYFVLTVCGRTAQNNTLLEALVFH